MCVMIDRCTWSLNHYHAMSGNGGDSMRSRRRAMQRQIGARIRKLRRAKDWSREVLAQRLGVSLHTVKRWELGIQAIPTDDLVRLLQVLEVTFEELVLGDRAPVLPPAQRNELAISLNRLIRAARPLLQSPQRKEEE